MTMRRVTVAEDRAKSVRRRRRRGTPVERLARTDLAQNVLAALLAASLRFVNATSRITYEPQPSEAIFAELAPFIVTAWHGQAFMLPFVRPPTFAVDVLASRHADGELISRVLVRLGCGVIRGSGASDPARMHEKGAVAGFRAMKAALDQGRTIAMTADFLRNARRKVGPGVIALARMSGRPIMPVAFVSSRRREIGSSWDRTTISLPFGHAACFIGDPVLVPADADEGGLEAKRVELETKLDAVTVRAHEIVDGRRG